ncbi:MAG TPA: hypothetical protein VH599_22520 [Ktedonobacterales bacterium]
MQRRPWQRTHLQRRLEGGRGAEGACTAAVPGGATLRQGARCHLERRLPGGLSFRRKSRRRCARI